MTQGATKQDIGNQINISPTKNNPADADKFGFWDTIGLRLVNISFSNLRTYLGNGAFQRNLSDDLSLSNGVSLVTTEYINAGIYDITLAGDADLRIL